MGFDVVAHETWFTEARPPFDWSFTLAWPTVVLVAGSVVVAAGWRLAGRLLPSPELRFLQPLGRLAPWIPRLLGIHAGVSLLAQAARGTYLAPALDLPPGLGGTLLAVAEGLVGVWLVTGFRVRAAAALLVAAGPLGMPAYGVLPIVERMDLLGIALFLAMVPPADTPGGAVAVRAERLAPAAFLLRLLVGGSLIVLAFTEKLARPELAVAFLDKYPAFNLMSGLGISVSDLDFVRVAGAVELLFGLLIISGALPQLAVIAAGIPFNATLFFLGVPELLGHLPIYGAMLALLVYGSNREWAWVTSWWPGADRAAVRGGGLRASSA